METARDGNASKPQIINDVVYETREIIPDIVTYIEDTLDQLQPLKYIFEDVFRADKLLERLYNDLPNGCCTVCKDVFIQDIVRLCSLFSRVKKNTRMTIQLEIVHTNKCRLFHEDYYRQRLLCTYRGPGTEWLHHSNVNREALGKGCNEKIVKDFSAIKRANTFDVIIIKGASYEIGELSIVHRSPPIEAEKLTRVLLKIHE